MRTRQHPTKPWRRIPWPTKAQTRVWEELDDSRPPDGEPDGEFSSFVTWVNKAASWIGGTGAKCFDAKNRRCRQGSDFMRARDEGAFPVRYYFPERFQPKWPRIGALNTDDPMEKRKVEIVGETPKHYRVRVIEVMRLSSRGRWFLPGEQTLVPKSAVILPEVA